VTLAGGSVKIETLNFFFIEQISYSLMSLLHRCELAVILKYQHVFEDGTKHYDVIIEV
jgi:hypothetical protein